MMTEHKFPNLAKPFDNNINAKLGHYVYGLFDPESGEIFYVGKAGGKEGRGNARVLSHFEEAKDRIFELDNSPKIEKIHEIWARKQEVEWKILRSGLASEREAFNVEAALIDTLKVCGHEILNDQGGHHSNRCGLLRSDDVYAWAAQEIDLASIPNEMRERPIFVFNIQNAVKAMWKERGQPDYVEATRRAWKVAHKWRRMENAIAIGLVDGISRAAFEVECWKPDDVLPNLYQMLPRPLPDDLEKVLKEKSFFQVLEPCKGYMQFGGYPIIKFPKDDDSVVFLRGINSNKFSK